eukprot:15284532-Alexandrium_andersonii.AAC.1
MSKCAVRVSCVPAKLGANAAHRRAHAGSNQARHARMHISRALHVLRSGSLPRARAGSNQA